MPAKHTSKWSGFARGLLYRNSSTGEYAFTEEGIVELEELLRAGSPAQEIADFFTVDLEWIERQLIDEEGEYHDMYRSLTAELKRDVRKIQIAVARQNASAAKFLGMHVLGQTAELPPPPEDPTRNVVGALPDYEQSPDVWRHQFGPRGELKEQESTIEKLQRMRRDADEAEIVETETPKSE